MDVWRITIAALRRWYILLPLLALTGFAVMQAGIQKNPEYEGRASAMLSPARVMSEIANPYSSLNGAQEALGIVLNSPETRREIADQGIAASYQVSAAARSSIFQVSTRAQTPSAAEDTAQAVLDYAAEELSTRQGEADLPERAQFTMQVLENPSVIGVVENSTLRVQAVVAALGAGLSVLVAVLFDDIVGAFKRSRAKRRRRRAATRSVSDDEHPGQLTLDDIPVVTMDLAPPERTTPRTGERLGEDHAQRAARVGGRTGIYGDRRSHTSLLSESEPNATQAAETEAHVPRDSDQPRQADDDAAETKAAVAAGDDRSTSHNTAHRS